MMSILFKLIQILFNSQKLLPVCKISNLFSTKMIVRTWTLDNISLPPVF